MLMSAIFHMQRLGLENVNLEGKGGGGVEPRGNLFFISLKSEVNITFQ